MDEEVKREGEVIETEEPGEESGTEVTPEENKEVSEESSTE